MPLLAIFIFSMAIRSFPGMDIILNYSVPLKVDARRDQISPLNFSKEAYTKQRLRNFDANSTRTVTKVLSRTKAITPRYVIPSRPLPLSPAPKMGHYKEKKNWKSKRLRKRFKTFFKITPNGVISRVNAALTNGVNLGQKAIEKPLKESFQSKTMYKDWVNVSFRRQRILKRDEGILKSDNTLHQIRPRIPQELRNSLKSKELLREDYTSVSKVPSKDIAASETVRSKQLLQQNNMAFSKVRINAMSLSPTEGSEMPPLVAQEAQSVAAELNVNCSESRKGKTLDYNKLHNKTRTVFNKLSSYEVFKQNQRTPIVSLLSRSKRKSLLSRSKRKSLLSRSKRKAKRIDKDYKKPRAIENKKPKEIEAKKLPKIEVEKLGAIEEEKMKELQAEKSQALGDVSLLAPAISQLEEIEAEKLKAIDDEIVKELKAEKSKAVEDKNLQDIEAEKLKAIGGKKLKELEAEKSKAVQNKNLQDTEAEKRNEIENEKVKELETEKPKAIEDKKLHAIEAEILKAIGDDKLKELYDDKSKEEQAEERQHAGAEIEKAIVDNIILQELGNAKSKATGANEQKAEPQIEQGMVDTESNESEAGQIKDQTFAELKAENIKAAEKLKALEAERYRAAEKLIELEAARLRAEEASLLLKAAIPEAVTLEAGSNDIPITEADETSSAAETTTQAGWTDTLTICAVASGIGVLLLAIIIAICAVKYCKKSPPKTSPPGTETQPLIAGTKTIETTTKTTTIPATTDLNPKPTVKYSRITETIKTPEKPVEKPAEKPAK